MIFINPPDINAEDLLERVAQLGSDGESSSLSIPESLRERLGAEYLYYEASFDPRSPQPTGVLTETEASTMRDAYDQFKKRAAHREDRERIHATVEAIVDKCPYCGISEAVQFDHFAPKRGVNPFPQFAILPSNLVQVCGYCNQLKSATSRASLAEIPFLHPYFDRRLMDGVELAIDLGVTNGNPMLDVSLEFGDNVPPDVAGVIRNHYQRFDLIARLRKACVGELGSAVDVARAGHFSVEMALDLHERIAATKLRLYGPWHWDARLQAALSTDEPFWAQALAGRSPSRPN